MSFAERLTELFKRCDKIDNHKTINEHMIYIDTKDKIKNTLNHSIIESCEYSCEKNKCDFSECYKKINNSEIEYEKVFAQKVVEDIENHHFDYLPDQVDGFSICRLNRIILNMKNSRFKEDKGVSGIIDFQHILKTVFKNRW